MNFISTISQPRHYNAAPRSQNTTYNIQERLDEFTEHLCYTFYKNILEYQVQSDYHDCNNYRYYDCELIACNTLHGPTSLILIITFMVSRILLTRILFGQMINTLKKMSKTMSAITHPIQYFSVPLLILSFLRIELVF